MMPYACANVTAAVAALFVAVTLETPLRAGPAVAGDPAGWQEVTAAFHKLEATSYRMRMTAPGQSVITEHVPPDSTRVTTRITDEEGEIDTITVGNETRSRVSGPGVPGTWMCSSAGPRRLAIEFGDFVRVVEVSRRPDSLLEGRPVHTYEVTYRIQGRGETAQGKGQTATTKTTVYIDIQTGLPRRSVTSYPLGPGEVVVDYYDYGAPITIMLPACS